jgi:hypothetical protein
VARHSNSSRKSGQILTTVASLARPSQPQTSVGGIRRRGVRGRGLRRGAALLVDRVCRLDMQAIVLGLHLHTTAEGQPGEIKSRVLAR